MCRFYKPSLWIPQLFLLTNPNLHHGLLRNEVNNGGFHQYFVTSSGSYYGYAEKGLVAFGATQALDLLRRAKHILFPAISVPVDTETRRRLFLLSSSALPPPNGPTNWMS